MSMYCKRIKGLFGKKKVNMDERGTFTELLKDLAVTCKANISVLVFFVKMCWMMPLLQI